MGLFEIKQPVAPNMQQVSAKISNSSKKVFTKRTGDNILDRINMIRSKVEHELGHLKDEYLCIRTEKELIEYIDKCIENKIYAFDTETTGLDTITCEIVGFSLYTPGLRACYIPINHKSYIDGQNSSNQLNLEFIQTQILRLVDVPSIMHNAKFDVNVVYWQLGALINNLAWDTMIASKILDNRESAKLKWQYDDKIAQEGKVNDYSELFEGMDFSYVPINIAYLYGAKDAEITYKLYEWQKEKFNGEGYEKLKKLYTEIELPLVPIIANMQREGVSFDMKKADELKVKYNAKLEECLTEISDVCKQYQKEIAIYNKNNPKNQFVLPLNAGSSKQVSQFLYDVLGLKPLSEKHARGTGEEILKELDHPVCGVILKYRGISKLLTTYIEKMPKVVNPKTGKIHASFNQVGTDTGRLSSSDPNLQNIPSHNDEIRTMFVADNTCTTTITNGKLTLLSQDEILTEEGWKTIDNIKISDIIITDNKLKMEVLEVETERNNFTLYLKEV